MNGSYIILLNWNGWGDTIECLESLFRLHEPRTRVIVCDNSSTDNSLQRIKAWAEGRLNVFSYRNSGLKDLTFPPCRKPVKYHEYDRDEAEKGGKMEVDADLLLIQTGDNLGFAGGNNVGLRYVLARDDFDYVWLVNNDTVVAPNALIHMKKRMLEDPRSGMCGSTLLHYDEPDRVQAYGGGYYWKWIGLPWHQGRLRKASDYRNRSRVEKWSNYIVGASMLVSKEFLLDVGLMCEDYFLYFEELDWALRAKSRFNLVYAPESIVYHKVGASIGTSGSITKKSTICEYYSTRNRIFFTHKFFPEALVTVYCILFAAVVSRIILGRFDRAKMLLRLMFTKEWEHCSHVVNLKG